MDTDKSAPGAGERSSMPLLSDAQRAKIAQRLTFRPDREDVGQTLLLTKAALAGEVSGVEEAAELTAALVSALKRERVIVPVPVEPHPDSGEHHEQGLGEDDEIPLVKVETRWGTAVAAFTSTDELRAWDADARPMTMATQRVALGAGSDARSSSILINPSSKRPVLIPQAAVHALAAADTWVPAWKDGALAAELKALAAATCAEVVDVRLRPRSQDETGMWEGEIEVEVLVDLSGPNPPEEVRANLAAALSQISVHPRLKAAAQAVHLVPKPVHLA